jgi:GNAT superfamily N-acetyltransferase
VRATSRDHRPVISLRVTDDPADVSAIVALHVVSWRATYRGMYSDDYLDNVVEGERLERWRARFADRTGRWTMLAEDGGELVGFVHLELDEEPAWGPLLENLHAAPHRKRQGIGRLLLAEAGRFVASDRPGEPMHLWVLDQNSNARGFYAACGGEDVETSHWTGPEGTPILSHRIVWREPGSLA